MRVVIQREVEGPVLRFQTSPYAHDPAANTNTSSYFSHNVLPANPSEICTKGQYRTLLALQQ
jgi:hypothetical protein